MKRRRRNDDDNDKEPAVAASPTAASRKKQKTTTSTTSPTRVAYSLIVLHALDDAMTDCYMLQSSLLSPMETRLLRDAHGAGANDDQRFQAIDKILTSASTQRLKTMRVERASMPIKVHKFVDHVYSISFR